VKEYNCALTRLDFRQEEELMSLFSSSCWNCSRLGTRHRDVYFAESLDAEISQLHLKMDLVPVHWKDYE
jgi:hypothetical protein